jgi:hypothetical protein
MQKIRGPAFSDLRLGKTSAERESQEWPELLISGFFDPYGFARAAKKEGPFIFLGYKGSGKSAIGEHLRLTAMNDPTTFVRYLSLGDFPYTPFSKIIKGDLEPEAKYPTAWSWLLLLQLLDLLASDNGSTLQSDPKARAAIDQLKTAGLLTSKSLSHTVQLTTKRNFSFMWKGLGASKEDTSTRGTAADIPFLVEKLKEIVFATQSESKHLLVLDGLDEILTKRDAQYESMASLLYEADRLNLQFHRNKCPAKIVVLCRTDIYEGLPNANKNKLRQDAAVHLDWYHDPNSPSESNLLKLVNHRASLSAEVHIDIFDKYFPEFVEEKPVRRFLLEFTRHTPRDFVTLLNYIQRFNDTSGRMTPSQLLSGTRAYSVDYFVPEIKDELHGHLTPVEIDRVISLFSSLGKREFSYGEVVRCAEGFNPPLDLNLLEVLGHLFQCSALGTVEKVKGVTHFTVKYRNRNAVLNVGKRLILHRGMWKALNLS